MPRSSPLAGFVFLVLVLSGFVLAYGLYGTLATARSAEVVIASLIVAGFIARAICVAAAWQRVVVLRLGKFHGLRGPGLFGIIPIIDSVPYTIDVRVITSSFKAEKTLTRDTVPVDVDAVLFWKVFDPEKAALAVADHESAISWAAQTAL